MNNTKEKAKSLSAKNYKCILFIFLSHNVYSFETEAAFALQQGRASAVSRLYSIYLSQYRLLITGDYRSLSFHFFSTSNLPGYLKSILFSFPFHPSPFGPSIFKLPVLRHSNNTTYSPIGFLRGPEMSEHIAFPKLLSPISSPTRYDPRAEAEAPNTRDPRIRRAEQKRLREFVLTQYDKIPFNMAKNKRKISKNSVKKIQKIKSLNKAIHFPSPYLSVSFSHPKQQHRGSFMLKSKQKSLLLKRMVTATATATATVTRTFTASAGG